MNRTDWIYGIAPMSDPFYLAGTVLNTVCFFISFFSAFWLIINREAKLINQSQPVAGFLAQFSLALLHGSLLLALGRPMTLGLCLGRIWGVQLALFAFLASQLMKGWTLFRFTQMSRVAIIRIAEDRPLIIALSLLVVFSVILVLWTVLEPVSASSDGESCESSGKDAEIAALICLGLLWLFWAFFSAQTYELKSRLTEYNYITSFVCGLASAMAIVATHETTVFVPKVRFVTESVCASCASGAVIAFAIGPKLCADETLYEEEDPQEDKRARQALRRGTSASTMVRTVSMPSMDSGSVIASPPRRSLRRHGKRSGSSLSPLKSRRKTPAEDELKVVVYNPPPTFTEMGQWI